MMTSEQAVVGLLVVAALVMAVAIALVGPRLSRARRQRLRAQFGPEYERAVEAYGEPSRADRELAARARRVHRLHLHDISPNDRAHFAATWRDVQSRFVDEPERAVREANELIKAIMAARGYPEAQFEQRVADLSVDHPAVVQHYRAARELSQSERQGGNTEDLRQAIIHFRALFVELIDAAPPGQPHTLQHA